MNIENLSTLKIHKLTQEQYDRALAEGNIDPNAFYLTPESSVKGVSPHIGDNGNWWIGDEDTGVAATAGAEAAEGAASRAESYASQASSSAVEADSAATAAKGYRDETKSMLDNALIDPSEAVLVTEQNLTETQKVTALENIGAASKADVEALNNEKVDMEQVKAYIEEVFLGGAW